MSVLPIYNTIVLPDATVYFKADYYRSLTGKEPVKDGKVVLLAAKEPLSMDQVTPDSFYRIGITGTITELNQQGFIAIRLRNRVDVNEIAIYGDRSIDLDISRRGDIDDLDREDAEKRLLALKEAILEFAGGMPWGQLLRTYAAQWTNIGEIAAALSPWLTSPNEDRYAILAEDSLQTRFDMLEKMIYENLELMKVGNEVRTAQEEDQQKLYRESAIKKQLEYLQNELDEMHPENVSDLQKLASVIGMRIEWDGMPEHGDQKQLSLFLLAAREAMANAYKHGRAETLYISVRESDKELSAVFTNDGLVPEPNAGEKGGLLNLRSRIESAGGSMKTAADPEFRLSVSIPKGGEEDVL